MRSFNQGVPAFVAGQEGVSFVEEAPGALGAAFRPRPVVHDAVAVVEPAVVEAACRAQGLALQAAGLAEVEDQLVPLRVVEFLMLSVSVPVGCLFHVRFLLFRAEPGLGGQKPKGRKNSTLKPGKRRPQTQ